MLLNSFAFLVFFTIVFISFWKIPKRYQWVLLLLAGYYFYESWKPAYAGLLLVSTLVNYYCATAMYHSPLRKKLYLSLALVLNLGALLIFKYLDFFSLTLGEIGNRTLPQFKLLVPIGISFYTLQVIGYLLDVYKGNIKPEKHLGFFALFLCFFPQINAGPIERGKTLLPQLKKQHKFDYDQVASGMRLFTFGLFKKIIIADNLGLVVDRVFGSLPEYRGLALVITILFYTWQIYMDFSGYTDMARGIARMVGINLIENFNLPYLATSVRDFWKRWHISFSYWLRDYIYFPLGGNRKGLPRTVLNTFIVFTVSGLWHGAAWTFVLWGVLHGISISMERVIVKFLPNRLKLPSLVKIAYAYCLISIFWIFFRANSLQDALYILRNSLVGIKNFYVPNYLWASLDQLFAYDRVAMAITFGALLIAVSSELIRSRISFSLMLSKQPAFVRLAFFSILVFLIIQFRNSDIKEFIYTRF